MATLFLLLKLLPKQPEEECVLLFGLEQSSTKQEMKRCIFSAVSPGPANSNFCHKGGFGLKEKTKAVCSLQHVGRTK